MEKPSENPTFKLIYFDAKALGEPIRILFAYGDISYEDIRIPRFGKEWPKIKSTFPMEKLPVLEIDGIRVHQSIAITRYVAKQVGLAGSNDWENLLIDISVDTVNEFRAKIVSVYYEPNEVTKQKKFNDLRKDVIPFYLDKLDAIAKENSGYLAIGKLTWADVFFLGIYDYLNFIFGSDLVKNHSNLKQVIMNVSKVPSIAAWLEKRPKTDL